MVEIVKVIRYQASDGEIFDTVAQAVRHEIRQELISLFDGEGAYNQIDITGAADTVMANKMKIHGLLSQLMATECAP